MHFHTLSRPRSRVGVAVAVLTAALTLPLISSTPASAAVSVSTGGPFGYTEQEAPVTIGTGTSVTGGGFYDGEYIDFEITDATAEENLALVSVSTPDTTDGVVSVVGTAVYIGTGANAVPIGSIDGASDGQGGTKLRVNFGSDFRNAGFEDGEIDPWTALEQRIELGVSEIAGFTANDTVAYPGNSGGDGDAPNSSSFTVALTSSDPPSPTEGTYALGLTSSMQTKNGCDVVHGPAAYSGPFDAAAGQTLTFDWRAYAGSDAYSVFGYLLNTSSGAQTEVLDATTTNTNGTTNWATVEVEVPTTGTYRFVFVSGTYDATCGRAAGASLYIDNFQVISADFVDDAMVSKVAELVTYEHTGDDPDASRTVTVTAQSIDNGSESGTISVNITPVNDAPVGNPLGEEWENLPGDDTFSDLTGTADFDDSDDASLTYSIDGGTPGSYSVDGSDYDHRLVGTYGTLYVDEDTGNYRIVPNDAAIEAVTGSAASEEFTIVGSDGSATGTAALTLGILLPPAPRNVTGTPGDGEVDVDWDQPGETTGITGYTATASPGGQSCTVVGVAVTTCTVTGLTNGTAYTFTVTPTTGDGPGTTSLASDPVIPIGPPTAPQGVTLTPGDGRALVSWDAPANIGGTPITGYTATASPGGTSCSTTGARSCTVLGLAIGTPYTITVVATNSEGSSPASDGAEITLTTTTATTLAVSDSTIGEGDSITLTATVTGGDPTGDVEFFDGDTSLGTETLSDGTAELTTDALGAGVRSLTAVYAGDGVHGSSTSPAQTVTVVADTTVVLAASKDTVGSGKPLSLTATVTGDDPSGSIEFFDGATSLGTAPIVAGKATFITSSLAVGVHSLSAAYAGDDTNAAATSAGVEVEVLVSVTMALAASDTEIDDGDSLTLTVTFTGGSPTGTVTFYDGATVVGTATITANKATLTLDDLATGVHAFKATYPGSASVASATSGTVVVTVLTQVTISLTVSDDAVSFGDPVTLTATVTGDDPTGDVEFFADGTSLGTAPLVGSSTAGASTVRGAISSAVATLVTTELSPGDHVITAVYSGNGANAAASAPQEIELLVAAPPVANSPTTNPSPGKPVIVNAEGFQPGETVEIWIDGKLVTTVTAGPDGSVEAEVTLDADTDDNVEIEVRGPDAAGEPKTVAIELEVIPDLAFTGDAIMSTTMVAMLLVLVGALMLIALGAHNSRRRGAGAN